jgi:aminopeptidase-like protein/aminoglycoside N3'-acetyltransferase
MTATASPTPAAAAYTADHLSRALRELGIRPGDAVMVHVCLETLGALADAAGQDERDARVLAALRDAVGPTGSLFVPTYSFSFCRGEDFDREETPASAGPWSTSTAFLERFRRLPGAVRSSDPIHSIAGIGPLASAVLDDVPPTCFGPGSVFSRLLDRDAKLLVIGAPLEEATFRHHAEELAGVPFRFKKLFTGRIREAGRTRKSGWTYSVRLMADNAYPDGARLEALARDAGVCRAARVGAGEVLAVECRAYYELTVRELRRDPWLTARGPAADPVALEEARTGRTRFDVRLASGATMPQMVDALWRLPRDIVSDGYDAALEALAGQVPMSVHEFPSGLECWSWIVPEKWACREAHLETMDGRRIFTSADNPLHVMSYSLPFSGVVEREELLRHLHVHPTLPDAVPFIFKYYERDWGLCCSRTMRDALRDEHYRVVIDSGFSYGTLKVGEVVVPGEREDSIVLCAHLCHPAMVNDDLTGVVVGVDVMRALLAGRRRRYTYRLLIVPETIGSVAFLSRHPELLPRLKGGLFLEMLGRDHPHALQHSFAGTSAVDRCFALALRQGDPAGWTTPFRSLAGNDERQFNAPGVRVPMLALTRQLPPGAPDHPYREYHSSEDTPDRVPPGSLERSRDLVLRMIDTLEGDTVPVNRFAGEVFCSRFGIHIDAYADPEGHKALFDLLFLIDGTRSVSQLAEQCGISFDAARRTVDELRRRGVVTE